MTYLLVNHFPNKRVCSRSFENTVEKEKLLVTSNFSFFRIVIFPHCFQPFWRTFSKSLDTNHKKAVLQLYDSILFLFLGVDFTFGHTILNEPSVLRFAAIYFYLVFAHVSISVEEVCVEKFEFARRQE